MRSHPGKRLRAAFWSMIAWLRAGYADEAPRTGYSPLIALNGPIALSDRETHEIATEFVAVRCDPTDIAVAITRVTGRLPSPSQVQKIGKTLDARKTIVSPTNGRWHRGRKDAG
jgi:Protein of unknown function (DUF3349)